ncbi:protamine P1 [Seiridium cupressi]
MTFDAPGMETLRDRRMSLVEEPIYCAAYDDGEEVLCLGSDEALSRPERVAKRLRYEDHALRYLRGQRPRLLSASLRGPFDRASGWRNPWFPENQVIRNRNDSANHIPAPQPSKTPVHTNDTSKICLEIVGALVHQTPATRDSLQCHLPSPHSHRELELEFADDPQLNTDTRSRIQEWAKNVPVDNFQRDDFWAPADGIADIFDGGVTPKRPAGKDWLKSKLYKRRRKDCTSFVTASTPTPAPAPLSGDEAARAVSFGSLGRPSQITATASYNSGQNTPGSCAGTRLEGLFNRPSSKGKAYANDQSRKTRSPPHNVAVKMSAFPMDPDKEHQQTSTSSNCDASNARSSALPSETLQPVTGSSLGLTVAAQGQQTDHDELDANKVNVEFSHKAHNQHNIEQQTVPSEQGAVSFESHLDRSFHYKARTVKQDAVKLGNESMVGNQSHPAQTATPESEDHSETVGVHQLEASDGTERDSLKQHIYGNSRKPPVHHSVAQQEATGKPEEELQTATTLGEAKDSFPELKEAAMCEGTTLLGETDNSESNQQKLDAPQRLPGSVNEIESISNGGKIVLQVAKQTPRASSQRPWTEGMADEGSTLIGDVTEVDASTPLRIARPPERLEAVKSIPQPVSALGPEVPHPELREKLETSLCVNELPGNPSKAQQPTEASLLNNTPGARDVPMPGRTPPLSNTLPAKTNCSVPHLEELSSANGNEVVPDDVSDAEDSIVMVPLSQAEWTVLDCTDVPTHPVDDFPEQSELASINIESVVQEESLREGPGAVVVQSPWIPDGRDIKVEAAGEKEWVSWSLPASVSDSPMEPTPQPETGSSRQEPAARTVDGQVHVAALHNSEVLRLPLVREPSQISLGSPKEQQSSWNTPNNHAMNTVQQGVPSSPSHQPLPINSSSATSTALHHACIAPNIPSVSVGLFNISQPELPAQPATPLETDGRQRTPEPNLSIKSFATFNTPSPKPRRISKHLRLSGDRLPSTQMLADAANNNPWNSVRSSLRSSVRSRSRLRVSFALLPGEDSDNDAPERSPHSTTKAVASPPPLSMLDAEDGDVSDHFHKHFDAVKQKTTNDKMNTKFRFESRLLPSESQQKPLSPEVGMMAQAFKEADEQHKLRSSSEPDIMIDEPQNEVNDEHGAGPQSPWRNESQGQGTDDVTAVLQNLDDFLNPRWDVEAEMDKAGTADGIENQRQEPSPGLLRGNVWDVL